MRVNFENHLSASEYKWFAIYSKYRCEKLAYNHLLRKKIQAYLPLSFYPKPGSTKKRTVGIPLIPNYVFVKITNKEYVKVLETLHVQYFLKIANNLISIPEEEINTLKRFVGNNDVKLANNTSHLEKGNWVEIISGPLSGVKGILLEIQGKKNISVKLNTLGFALNMEVPVSIVKKISNPDQDLSLQASM